MPPFARASELDRLLACPGGGWLARNDWKPPAVRRAADWGSASHFWKETGRLPGGVGFAYHAKALHARIGASGIDRDALWPPDLGKHEVAMALNVVSGRAAVYGGADTSVAGRDAWKKAHSDEWVVGTADWAGELLGSPWLDDLKTGREAHPDQFRAQQAMYSASWALATGALRDVRSTITHWPWYPQEAPAVRTGRIFSLDYLSGFVLELRRLRDRILAAQETSINVGEHCRYCPSRRYCNPYKENRKKKDEQVV